MTSNSPVPASGPAPPARGREPLAGEFGPDIRPGVTQVAASTSPEVGPGGLPRTIWHMAHCHRCSDESFSEPFTTESARDTWAIEHLLGEGHTVHLSVDGLDIGLHMSAYLRRTEDGDGFRWLCMAPACVRWVGPYDTPQLALADWRHHDGTTR